MRATIQGIDHLVVLVRDIDRAERTFRELGFLPTPRGVHTLGSLNHCLMFERDYLELLAVPKPNPVMAGFSEFLSHGEGLAAIALATHDANALHRSLADAGIAAAPPVDFSRPVSLDGGTRDARFRVMLVPPAETPGAQVFACQHYTRDLVWRPEYLAHPLGVTGISAVVVADVDGSPAARGFERVLGASVQADAPGATLACGAARLCFVDAEAVRQWLPGVALSARAAPMLAAIRLRVRDVDEALRCLRAGGRRVAQLADGSIAIGADEAHGVALVFTAEDAA